MATIKNSGHNCLTQNPGYFDLGAVNFNGAPSTQAQSVPAFGRGIDGDLVVAASSTYNPNTTRNAASLTFSGNAFVQNVVAAQSNIPVIAIAAGQKLAGPGIGAQATVTGVAQNVTFTAQTTAGSATMSTLSVATSSFVVGQLIVGSSGTGLASNCYVQAIGANTLTLSQPSTVSGTGQNFVAYQAVLVAGASGTSAQGGTYVAQSQPVARTVDCPVAQVTALDPAQTDRTLTVSPLAGVVSDFAPGDVVVLLNQQGAAAAYNNVGRWELNQIAQVSGNQVVLTNAFANQYGASDNTAVGTAQINLYRLAEYSSVTLKPQATMTAQAWQGTWGGICAWACSGTVLGATGASISMSGLGYRAGTTAGAQGEGSQGGYNVAATSASGSGGGGGGNGDNGLAGAAPQDAVANVNGGYIYGGGGGAGGGGAGGGAGGGGGYATSGGQGGYGAAGGGGNSGSLLTYQQPYLPQNLGGTATNGQSQTGGASISFTGVIDGSLGYTSQGGAGGASGGYTKSTPVAGSSLGQATLTQMFLGGAGGNAGSGGIGGAGAHGQNVNNTSNQSGSYAYSGCAGGGGGNGGGFAANTFVNAPATAGTATAAISGNVKVGNDASTGGLVVSQAGGQAGNGGGAILIIARTLDTVSATADGQPGTKGGAAGVGGYAGYGLLCVSNNPQYYYGMGGNSGGGGGGGGAGGGGGGTILLMAYNIVSLGNVSAQGGTGGLGGNAGNGGNTYNPATQKNLMGPSGATGQNGGSGALGRIKVLYQFMQTVQAASANAPNDGANALTATIPPAFKQTL